MPEFCSICHRETPDVYLEDHHLVPRCKKGKNTIVLCTDCADQVHLLFNVKELRDTYNTLESLLSNEKIQTWIKWIRKKPQEFGSVCMKHLKRKQ
jgi:hypothetical protein